MKVRNIKVMVRGGHPLEYMTFITDFKNGKFVSTKSGVSFAPEEVIVLS